MNSIDPEMRCPDCPCCRYLSCKPGPDSDCGWDEESGEYRCPCVSEARRVSRKLGCASALRYLGLRDRLHPLDASVWAFPDRQSADRSARRDRDLHGNAVYGPWETEAGWVQVVDLTPAMRSQGLERCIIDPSLPDDYMPGKSAA